MDLANDASGLLLLLLLLARKVETSPPPPPDLLGVVVEASVRGVLKLMDPK